MDEEGVAQDMLPGGHLEGLERGQRILPTQAWPERRLSRWAALVSYTATLCAGMGFSEQAGSVWSPSQCCGELPWSL